VDGGAADADPLAGEAAEDQADGGSAAEAKAVAEIDDTASDSEAETDDAEPADKAETADGDIEPAAEDETAADELSACPKCDTAVEPGDAFCPGCGEDLDAHRGSDDEGDADELDTCPGCGGDVEPSDAFCASCGEDLDAHRENKAAELDACPGCGGDVEPGDAFCASCGEDLDAHRAGDVPGTTDESGSGTVAPSTLALTAFGSSVVVDDGQTVGREIRSLLADAGKKEEEAVRIHREHVRFVRDGDQFHVVDMGENPTELNGARMTKGDKQPIGPGDELGLSNVVTLSVEHP